LPSTHERWRHPKSESGGHWLLPRRYRSVVIGKRKLPHPDAQRIFYLISIYIQ
jgi:hypothetical protein